LISNSGENPIAVSTLRPSALAKIQELLLRGERRQAYHFALDEKLWAHAMVIASGIDKEAWKEVVNEFLRTELGVKDDERRLPAMSRSNEPPPPATNGREWLRVAYSLFSGQGPAAGELSLVTLVAIQTHEASHI
jgi:COPII coat assembly protein SEC16